MLNCFLQDYAQLKVGESKKRAMSVSEHVKSHTKFKQNEADFKVAASIGLANSANTQDFAIKMAQHTVRRCRLTSG